MQKTTIAALITTGVIAALSLTGCTNASTTDGAAARPSASAATKAPKATSEAGLADVTGKCTSGQATPVQSDKQISIADCDLVDLMGTGNTVTAGAVEHLVIEGDDNVVTVASTTEVTTIGNGNTVYYASGAEPKFNERAEGNTVEPVSQKQ